ncbi:MAG: hypothetical protein OCU20_09255 [Methanophagales archaeon]|nr:hypothetical protein [Methanophagales archaeon]
MKVAETQFPSSWHKLRPEIEKDLCRIFSPKGSRSLQAKIDYTTNTAFDSTTANRHLSSTEVLVSHVITEF